MSITTGPLLAAVALAGAAEEPMIAYVGTQTGGASEGIYRVALDPRTGRLTKLGLAAAARNPTFLAVAPGKKAVYAVADVDGQAGVAAFRIKGADGELEPLGEAAVGGGGPCHIGVTPAGDVAMIANYGSGSVGAVSINRDGTLGAKSAFVQHEGSSAHPQRQKGPHAHSITPSPDGRFAFAADLGTDKLYVYRIGAGGTLTPHEPAAVDLPPGSGPRHFTFHPNGRFAYVINELRSTVTAFAYDAEAGTLETLQTVGTLPEGFDGSNTTSEVRVTPDGSFLIGANRGDDSLAVFRVADDGTLTPVGRHGVMGAVPRNFEISPDGRFVVVANQGSGSVVSLKLDPDTGRLSDTGSKLEFDKPMCVRFLTTGD